MKEEAYEQAEINGKHKEEDMDEKESTSSETQEDVELYVDSGVEPVLPDIIPGSNGEDVQYRYTALVDEGGFYLRNAYAYDKIINQFEVENENGRYKPDGPNENITWCNMFMCDVLGACGLLEFKQYSDTAGHNKLSMWDNARIEEAINLAKLNNQFKANALYYYFKMPEMQEAHGLITVDYKLAQRFANNGIPVFGLYVSLNDAGEPSGSGHCVIVRPENEKWIAEGDVIVAQAGNNLLNYSRYNREPTLYFVHIRNEYIPLELYDELSCEQKVFVNANAIVKDFY